MRNGIARFCLSAALLATSCVSTTVQAAANDPSIARSNAYTQRVLDVVFKHAPEWASEQGLSQFDSLVANPTLAEQMTQRRELEAVVADAGNWFVKYIPARVERGGGREPKVG